MPKQQRQKEDVCMRQTSAYSTHAMAQVIQHGAMHGCDTENREKRATLLAKCSRANENETKTNIRACGISNEQKKHAACHCIYCTQVLLIST